MARIDDGFSTTIILSATSSGVTLEMFEKEVQPPGISAGGEIDTTTMLNTLYRTKEPKSLLTLMPLSLVVAYGSVLYDEMILQIKTNQLITITFPDASTIVFWGWIDEFAPNNLVEGEQPTANITIIPSNKNNAGTEVAPVHTPAP